MRQQVLVFPLASLLNSFAMTGLLLVFGLLGYAEQAADIGIVQGATLALFYAFSANARNVILADANSSVASDLLRIRLLLIVPLAALSGLLAVGIGGADVWIATVLIARRACEWIGDVAIASHERRGIAEPVQATIVTEIVTLLICVGGPIAFGVPLALAAIPWAAAPVLAAARMPIRSAMIGSVRLAPLLPHFGSTAVIGAGVFVFRTSIVLLVGKAAAGDLFTAFAIGGLIPTIFGQALAPTIAHRYGAGRWPAWFLAVPVLLLVIAAVLGSVVLLEPSWLDAIGRTAEFGFAVALSIAGGAIMLVALSLRTRLIHASGGDAVFGPDLLANILIATGVPFVFFFLGPQALGGLYLLSACISLLFLVRAPADDHVAVARWVVGGISAAIVIPLFFQADAGIFRSPAMLFDPQGIVTRLPLPLSVFAVFAGIAVLGLYAAAVRSMVVLFFTTVLFVTSSLLVADTDHLGPKLILLAQFLLPMFGLVLGEMVGRAERDQVMERVSIAIFGALIPLQLLATWLSGHTTLVPKVFVFSVYQHIQYVPTVVVALIVAATLSLWGRTQRATRFLSVLWPTLAVYTTAATSITSLLMCLTGLLILVLHAKTTSAEARLAVRTAAVSVALIAGYLFLSVVGLPVLPNAGFRPAELTLLEKFDFVATDGVTPALAPAGILDRLSYWKYYLTGIFDEPIGALFGHAIPPDRTTVPSAHNYALDFVYNFGVIAALPLAILLVDTARQSWQHRRDIMSEPMLMGVLLATGMLIAENLIKVGLRQPYPGIVTFFLWGLLLARIARLQIRPTHP